MERRHELVLGVEGELGDSRVYLPGQDGVDAAFRGQHDQGSLGRVADQLAVAEHRAGGEDHRHQELVQRDLRLPGGAVDAPVGRVALSLDRIAVPGDDHLDRGHLVQRERPGLVRVDRGRGPQGLGRRELLHDGADLDQSPGAPRQDRRHHHGQLHRDRRDGEGDRGGQHRVEGIAARQVHGHRRDQRDTRDQQELL